MKKFKGYTKGINLGGWLSQCTDHYNHEHYRSFITKGDLKKVASYGLDHVRLPIDYNVIQNEDGSIKEDGFVYIDNCLEWAHELHLNVVLDLHKTCGFVFDDKNYCNFFTNEQLQAQFYDLWEELANRYGQLDYVAFELLNEVTAREMAEPWNAIIKKAVPRIRSIAPKVPIIVGGIYNSSITGLSLMEAPCDSNMVYTFHCYSPMIFTHQAAGWIETMPRDFHTTYPKTASEYRELSKGVFGNDFDGEFVSLGDQMLNETFFDALFKEAIAVAEKYDVPLYCGEYGVIDQADCESTVNWYRDIHKAFETYDIAHSAWTYKAMDFGVTQEHLVPVYDKLVEVLGK